MVSSHAAVQYQESAAEAHPKEGEHAPPAGAIQYYLTDPAQEILIAHDEHVKDNKPVTYKHTYQTFFESLAAPDSRLLTKDGPGYMNGPCHGLRRKVNVPYYHFAVLDGDSSLDEHGNRTEGAPSPVAVHTALKNYNLSHCIYTTYSHSFKGARWRLLIPTQINSAAELRGLLTYLVEILRVHCELPVYLTQESTTWGNRWHFPRTAHAEAPFYSACHFGYSLLPAPLALLYGQVDAMGQEYRETIPPRRNEGGGGSLIAQFCELYPLPDLLIANGYTFHGQSILADQHGRELPVMRFKKPDSSNGPGAIVYWDEDRWRGYSHHKTDVMNTGHSFDAFDVFRYLGSQGGPDEEDWFVKAAEAVKDRMLDYMGDHHPVVLEGSKFKIGYLIDNPVGPGVEYRLMRWEDFNMKMDKRPGIFLNMKQKDGTTALKMVGLAEWWRKCKERVDYDGVIFEPTRLGDSYSRTIQKGETKFFNLFNGWNFKPEPGSCELLEWHLREAICSGIEEEYEYLLDWLAHIFQFPAEKPNVALVLRGGKGIGKSIVMSRLCASLGSLGLVIANTRQLTGDFNAHMRNKLLAVVEESFWAGSHTDEGPLKHLISDEYTTFERKGVDAEPGRSFIRLILITNNTWAAPASEDERRFFIPTLSNAAKDRQRKEGDYFTRLSRELNGGGINALVHKLMERRISKTAIRYPPQTSGLMNQKLLSLTGLKAWIYDALKAGAFRAYKADTAFPLADYPRENEIPMEVLENSALNYSSRYDSGRSIVTRVEMLLNDVFGKPKLTFISGKLLVTLPSLQQLRRSFEKFMDADIDWGE